MSLSFSASLIWNMYLEMLVINVIPIFSQKRKMHLHNIFPWCLGCERDNYKSWYHTESCIYFRTDTFYWLHKCMCWWEAASQKWEWAADQHHIHKLSMENQTQKTDSSQIQTLWKHNLAAHWIKLEWKMIHYVPLNKSTSFQRLIHTLKDSLYNWVMVWKSVVHQ